jgi:hypothetical protein
MPMSLEEIASVPRHPQLMDPADPEELIVASIWWYPVGFTHRTAVLQHLLLSGGNGYEWNSRGQVCSVFAHLEPDYFTLAERQDRFGDPGGEPPCLAALRREAVSAAARVRASAPARARAHGPVTITGGRPATGDAGGLMATRPARADPRWQALLDEARHLFSRAQAVQEAEGGNPAFVCAVALPPGKQELPLVHPVLEQETPRLVGEPAVHLPDGQPCRKPLPRATRIPLSDYRSAALRPGDGRQRRTCCGGNRATARAARGSAPWGQPGWLRPGQFEEVAGFRD